MWKVEVIGPMFKIIGVCQNIHTLTTLLFCLALQPLINCLESDLVLGYLDDVSGGGDLPTVARDVSMVEEYGAALGLSLNRSKCELIALAPPAVLPKSLEGFRLVAPSDAELLGAPHPGWYSHGQDT